MMVWGASADPSDGDWAAQVPPQPEPAEQSNRHETLEIRRPRRRGESHDRHRGGAEQQDAARHPPGPQADAGRRNSRGYQDADQRRPGVGWIG